jgi:hypothetical protein
LTWGEIMLTALLIALTIGAVAGFCGARCRLQLLIENLSIEHQSLTLAALGVELGVKTA